MTTTVFFIFVKTPPGEELLGATRLWVELQYILPLS